MKLSALQAVKRSGDGHPFGPLCSVKSQLDQTFERRPPFACQCRWFRLEMAKGKTRRYRMYPVYVLYMRFRKPNMK